MFQIDRTDELHTLMREHRKGCNDVAKLLGRSPQTVRAWRSRSSGRPIPRYALELLRFKLSKRK